MITLHQSSAATLQALFSSVASLEALSKNSTLIFLQLLMRLVSSTQACILILNPFHNNRCVNCWSAPPPSSTICFVHYPNWNVSLLFRHSTPRKRAGWGAARLRLGKNSQGQPWAGVEYSIRTKKEWDNKIFVWLMMNEYVLFLTWM